MKKEVSCFKVRLKLGMRIVNIFFVICGPALILFLSWGCIGMIAEWAHPVLGYIITIPSILYGDVMIIWVIKNIFTCLIYEIGVSDKEIVIKWAFKKRIISPDDIVYVSNEHKYVKNSRYKKMTVVFGNDEKFEVQSDMHTNYDRLLKNMKIARDNAKRAKK